MTLGTAATLNFHGERDNLGGVNRVLTRFRLARHSALDDFHQSRDGRRAAGRRVVEIVQLSSDASA